jgi:DNA-binding transcriptional regulator YiaG
MVGGLTVRVDLCYCRINYAKIAMSAKRFPATQGDLVRAARGELSQVKFAKALGVHATTLSRYESEDLGLPQHVINHCLRVVAQTADEQGPHTPVQRALQLAREAVSELERAQKAPSVEATQRARKPKPLRQR